MNIRRRFLGGQLNTGSEEVIKGTYTVSLNEQWVLSSNIPNPDTTLYDGVYESFSNYNISDSCASLTITIKNITTQFQRFII